MAFAYKGFVPRFPLQSDEESHMSSWKVDDEEVKVGRQWWRALKVALSKERLEVKERVMGKELRAELEVEEDTGKPTGWVRVVLPLVTRETEGNLGFSFRDTQCPWWKGGILFDFIELRKIS